MFISIIIYNIINIEAVMKAMKIKQLFCVCKAISQDKLNNSDTL